ncbi:beta-galactosidase [Herbiconiux moechotypicola]|uniref:beta-galactosidase n=1 Tax=Herbiconiux moechotypicola TaxID=637393 RepID=A0ABP5QEJ5_9MICO|nr:beta-galactosidase [Herbiconiux moechotypicola]MCS5729597.1 beta-galactosidase [Herbiconiux moechotypicola]
MHSFSPSSLPPAALGVAYYPEYLQEDRLDADLDLMVAAGIRTIRIGESVWSTWEPRDGEFDTAWIVPVLDAAHARGIRVVLGTPTYAVPPWLMLAHPEIAGERRTGERILWGARQEADLHHPVFRRYAERLIRRMLTDVGAHPAIVGFQVDNEPGEHVLYNDGEFVRFREWLLENVGDVEHLNDAWNLTHWSHRLTRIEELWRPDGNLVPQYDLAWRRFQAESTAGYIAWQTAIVSEYAAPGTFITTCIDRDRAAVDERLLGEAVEVAGANLYLATQEAAAHGAPGSPRFPASGDWAALYGADRARGITGGPFLVTETNAQSVGSAWHTFPALDGQWRLFAWSFVARGARLVSYWNWHTMHASWETQWHGVLPHTFVPGRAYREIARLGAELVEAEGWTAGLAPEARVGLLYSTDAHRLWEFQAPVALASAPGAPALQGEPDRHAYEDVVYTWYGGFSRAGSQQRVLHDHDLTQLDAAELAAELPVLAVPALPVASDETLEWLGNYVEAGGHLVIGARSLVCDDEGRFRSTDALAALVGGAWSVDEFTSLRAAAPVHSPEQPTDVPLGELTGLLELLSVPADARGDVESGAEILAWADSVFGSSPAAVTVARGAGRVTYLAGFPTVELAEWLARWVADATPAARDGWRGDRLPGVQVQSAVGADGSRTWFLFNHTAASVAVALGGAFVDRLGADEQRHAGDGSATTDTVHLAPWGVAALEERA